MAYCESLDENDPVAITILALDKRLEEIRREQLTKNRSALRNLSCEQLQEVERLTSAITRKIFREVANELKHSTTKGDGRKIAETVSLMLGLV